MLRQEPQLILYVRQPGYCDNSFSKKLLVILVVNVGIVSNVEGFKGKIKKR